MSSTFFLNLFCLFPGNIGFLHMCNATSPSWLINLFVNMDSSPNPLRHPHHHLVTYLLLHLQSWTLSVVCLLMVPSILTNTCNMPWLAPPMHIGLFWRPWKNLWPQFCSQYCITSTGSTNSCQNMGQKVCPCEQGHQRWPIWGDIPQWDHCGIGIMFSTFSAALARTQQGITLGVSGPVGLTPLPCALQGSLGELFRQWWLMHSLR